MVVLERVTAENVWVYKAVRLRALQEDPGAFGSTYAREAGFTDEEWVRRLERWSGVVGCGFLARNEGVACGLVGVMLSEGDGHRADLVSMWTAPESRRLGVGRMLVEAASGWARERGLVGLRLMVVSNNLGAIGFYERLGFRASGVVEVYPNDVSLTEVEMVLAISR